MLGFKDSMNVREAILDQSVCNLYKNLFYGKYLERKQANSSKLLGNMFEDSYMVFLGLMHNNPA
jgi:hypothetical protein